MTIKIWTRSITVRMTKHTRLELIEKLLARLSRVLSSYKHPRILACRSAIDFGFLLRMVNLGLNQGIRVFLDER